MKVLSIKNPWAFWICAGIKDIENRTWRTKYRGKILIHTSLKMDSIEGIFKNYLNDNMKYTVKSVMNNIKDYYEYYLEETCGAIIGSVEIKDCVINHPSMWAEKSLEGFKPIYNWVLENPTLLKDPIFNVKGKLNFWDYDIEKKQLEM
jgi:hypothetical protein